MLALLHLTTVNQLIELAKRVLSRLQEPVKKHQDVNEMELDASKNMEHDSAKCLCVIGQDLYCKDVWR